MRRRVATLLLILTLIVGILPIEAKAAFVPRTTAPDSNDPHYTTLNPFYTSGYGMPNCTCYAWGRAYEILGKAPQLCTWQASLWYNYNVTNGFYSYSSDITKPAVGAIICWGGDDGHVAVVEKIDGNKIWISDSGYGRAEPFRYDWLNMNLTNLGYYNNPFLGYIYLLGNGNTPSTEEAPSAPDYVTVEWYNQSAMKATVSWPAVDGATYYEVEYDHMQDDWKTESDYSSGTSFIATGVGHLQYRYRVRACNSGGKSDWTVGTFAYAVRFDANGGSVSTSSKDVFYGKTYGDLPTPTRTGYNFDGWYTSTSGGSYMASYTKVTTMGTHTLYAHWSPKSCVAYFNTIGSVSPSSKTVYYDSTYGDLPTPIRDGYSFDGWYTSENGGSRVYSSTTVNTISTHSLYAHWTAIQYTVYFDAEGGTVSPGSKTVAYYDYYGDLPTPSRDGYAFEGWYTSAGNRIYSASVMNFTYSHTLYAHWSINSYTISFAAGGGSGSMSGKTLEYGSSYTLPSCAFTAPSGKQFKAWSINGTEYAPGAKITVNGNISVTAVWKNLPAVITSAKRSGSELYVTVTLDSGVSAKAVCAMYNAKGKMIGMETRTLTGSTEAGVYFAVNSKAAKAKIFIIGDNSVPLCASKEVSLK